jgi:ribulose-phosphate 3-epimerase
VSTLFPFRCSISLNASKLGQGGQKFIERCVPKVSELRSRFPEQNIEVDGGVGPSTVDACARAGKGIYSFYTWLRLNFLPGSNVIVAGTAIFNAEDPEGVIRKLKTAVDTAQATFASEREV